MSQHQHGSRPGNERPPVWALVVAAISLLVQPPADRRTDSLGRAQIVDAPGKNEDGRGRGASTPSNIPLRGWKDILWRSYHNIPEHRIISIAAGVTFFVLLSIFPGIAALVAIYGLFADPSSIGQHLNDLSGVLPGALVFMMIAVSAIAVLPLALGYLGLSGGVEWLIALGKWPLLVVTIAFGIALIYRYGPSRKEPQWRWVSWGSALAALLWLVTSILFSWYAGNFGNYDKTYGSLGAAVGLMTWMWLSFVVILVGAEQDAEMEHQTARDTTTGSPKPMGSRGAQAADTVGKASS